MLVNPDIEAWFEKLQGHPLGRGGSAPRGVPQDYAAAAAQGIIKPPSGMFDFRAPAINAERFQPRPPAPYPGERAPTGIPAPFTPMSGGGGDLGGAAKAAGLGKLGQGIESGLAAMKAKADAWAAIRGQGAYTPMSALDGPISQQMARNPGATMPNIPPASPYSPPPVGASSDIPLAAQAGAEGIQPVPPIGSGGSLPTFAQGAPGGTQTAGATDPRLLNYIYGEAGNQGPRGQQAVANVLANRAAENFRGYGTTMEAQATKGTGIWGGNSEFNGYKVPPASSVPGLQQALGNANNDITSGARFFANPAGSTPGNWATRLNSSNALKIGDHYFTDNTSGRPFSGSGTAPSSYASTPSTPSSAAYAAAPPNLNGPPESQLAGPSPAQNTGEPHLISPGQPQTGPAYSNDTWNNRPQYDYGGGQQAPVPVPPPRPQDMPGPQGMNDQGMNPLAAALANGPDQTPQLDQSSLLAMALSQPDFGSTPDFGSMPDFSASDFSPSFDFGGGGGFFGGLFG